jgi:hypothetical protein
MPLRYNSPDRGDLFTIIRKFLENPRTYDPGETKGRTIVTAQQIASAYRPHNVMPAIKTVLEYLKTKMIEFQSSPETDQAIHPYELKITNMVNDLLTWLNNLDECGDVEVVYMDNYPVTVSNDARTVLDRPGIHTSMIDIITPVDALEENGIMYIPDPESTQTKQWLKNMAMVHLENILDENGYVYDGMTVKDGIKEMLDKRVKIFPMHMFWFVVDGNNQIVALFGFRDIYWAEYGHTGPEYDGRWFRLWGFGYPRTDKDGLLYYYLDLDCSFPLDCYAYAQDYLDRNGWKLVTSCSPEFNPYDTNGPIFWSLLNAAGISVANPPQ